MSRLNTAIRYIQPGEPVTAGVANRPTSDLARRTRVIRERLEAYGPGNAAILTDMPITPEVKHGMPVYFNSTEEKFAPALAANTEDGLSPADSALVWGLAKVQSGLTVADIVLLGVDTELTLTEAGVADPEAGEYYLSSTTAGQLVRTAGSVPVRVCIVGFNDYIYVCPKPVGPPDGHTHYAFDIESVPAGTPDLTGFDENGDYTVEIDSADSTILGWLPADDAIFNGTAPAGAYFGYNLSKDADLAAAWPAEPPTAASMVLFDDIYYGREIKSGTEGLVQFTRDGIWWMSNRAIDAPWQFPSDSDVVPASLSATLTLPQSLRLFFHKSRYAAYRLAVTSLESDSEVLEIVSACDGTPASAGPLLIRYNPEFENETDADEGVIGIKSFNGGSFRRGPIVTGVTPLDDSVTVQSTYSGEDPAREGFTRYYGSIAIKFNDSPRELIISPELVKLSGGQQRYESDLLAIGLAAGTGCRMKFRLPGPSRFPPDAEASLRLWLSGNNNSSLPQLNVTFRRVPRTTTIATIPVTTDTITLTMPGAVEDDEYVEIESDSLAISADDLLLVEISRDAGDGYAGEVEILDAVLRVFTPE